MMLSNMTPNGSCISAESTMDFKMGKQSSEFVLSSPFPGPAASCLNLSINNGMDLTCQSYEGLNLSQQVLNLTYVPVSDFRPLMPPPSQSHHHNIGLNLSIQQGINLSRVDDQFYSNANYVDAYDSLCMEENFVFESPLNLQQRCSSPLNLTAIEDVAQQKSQYFTASQQSYCVSLEDYANPTVVDGRTTTEATISNNLDSFYDSIPPSPSNSLINNVPFDSHNIQNTTVYDEQYGPYSDVGEQFSQVFNPTFLYEKTASNNDLLQMDLSLNPSIDTTPFCVGDAPGNDVINDQASNLINEDLVEPGYHSNELYQCLTCFRDLTNTSIQTCNDCSFAQTQQHETYSTTMLDDDGNNSTSKTLLNCSFVGAETNKIKVDCKDGIHKYVCFICAAPFDDKVSHRQHMAKHASCKQSVCDICGVRLINQTGLQKHIRRVHSSQNKRKFKCKKCCTEFGDQSALIEHRRTFHVKERVVIEDEALKCNICGIFAINRASLGYHMWKHTGDSSYIYMTTA